MGAAGNLFLNQGSGHPSNGSPRGTRCYPGTVYFAFKPGSDVADRVVSVASSLYSRYELIGRVSPAVLHMTICPIGYLPELSDERIDAARKVAAGVVAKPFEIILDRVGTYRNGQEKPPLVAFANNGVPRANLLRHALVADLRRSGFPVPGKMPDLHMTLFYDRCIVAEEPVDPIRWMVRDFVLVHSIHGQGRHVLLGQWPMCE